jgi:Miro-like protein.
MAKFGSLVDYNLFSSDIAKSLLSPLMLKSGRRQYGSLESPVTNLYTGEVSYKVFFCGKTSTGKTTTIANASGRFGLHNAGETTGIQVTNVYWPVLICETKATVLFKISFWDVGESVLNSYNHILPSCMVDVDCIVYTFSMVNKSTWDDLPKVITRIDAEDHVLKIALGTKQDLVSHGKSQITSKMINDFEEVWKFPVIYLSNDEDDDNMDFADSFKKSSYFMNRLCELLWYRDQVKVGLIPKGLVNFCFKTKQNEADAHIHERSTSSNSLKGTKVTFC